MRSILTVSRRASVRVFAALALTALAACAGLPTMPIAGGPRINTNAPVPVALLVPAGSGQAGDQTLAQSLENAARLAMLDLDGVEIDLRVYPTAGQPAGAAEAATAAVSDGARIIIGPVYSGAASAAGAAVRGRGINVLAFSNNTDIAGGNVFVLGNTFENTADRIMSYAARQGIGSVHVAYGNDAAERKGNAAIAAAATRNGIAAVGTSPFELSQNAVVQAIPDMASAVQANGAESLFFTSGTAGALPILAQLLTENEIDPDEVQFLGLQRWDIPASALELPGLQGGWFALPDPGLASAFSSRYEAAYASPPHPIAGLAYDAINAIGALVGSGDSGALTGASLTQPSGFTGVNGVFRLRPNGTVERALAIATIRDKQVEVIDPAPRSFGGAGF